MLVNGIPSFILYFNIIQYSFLPILTVKTIEYVWILE